MLPGEWLLKPGSDRFSLCKTGPVTSSDQQPLLLSHCITVNSNLTWSLCVRGKTVNLETCTALRSIPSLLSNSSLASSLIERLEASNICIGNPDHQFAEVVDSHHGQILSPDGSNSAYNDDFSSFLFEGRHA